MTAAAIGRVVIADDHELTGKVLTRIFEAAGADVTVERDPDRVVEVVERVRPDLVVVDTQMPPRQAFHALSALADADPAAGPAIIAMSGEDVPQVRRRALELGADAFLAKPWDRHELLALSEELLKRRQSERGS